jgi:hypothetical protein
MVMAMAEEERDNEVPRLDGDGVEAEGVSAASKKRAREILSA